MSILDNNKKKRDQKSSDTEKELALAQLQDRFLGFKAPKADFLKKIVVGISPALLPKKDKVNLQTSDHTPAVEKHKLPLVNTNTIVNTPIVNTPIVNATIEVQTGQPSIAPSESIPPIVDPSIPSVQTQELPEPSDSSDTNVPQKPVSSFDFLDVGIGVPAPSAPKTKSFLAHFAKKDKVDKDKDK